MMMLLDIFLDNLLYAASYREMNDPMEAHFYRAEMSREEISNLYKLLSKKRICCFEGARSEFPKNKLMWSHYADSHRGVCLKVSLGKLPKGWEELPVSYTEYKPKGTDVNQILSFKTKDWSYENEVRFVQTVEKSKTPAKLKVKIEAVYFGLKMKAKDKSRLVKLISKIDPNIQMFEIKESGDAEFYPDLIVKEIKK